MDEDLRKTLLGAIARVKNMEYEDDDEMEALISFVQRHVPDPDIMGYWVDVMPSLTPEQVLDRAMSYQAINLPQNHQ